jgi:carboxylesterase
VSILDPAEQQRNLAYGVFTAPALRALQKTVERASNALPNVTAPTLVVQSREDNRISVAAAERAFAKLGAKEKRLEWISGAAHVITVDYGREHVFALLTSWMTAHGARPFSS